MTFLSQGWIWTDSRFSHVDEYRQIKPKYGWEMVPKERARLPSLVNLTAVGAIL